MEQTFEINRNSRKIIAPFLEKYTLDQLNLTPTGFNNNLIWNIGHIVVTQQLLVYNLSGLPMLVSDELVKKYKKGTKPEQPVTQAEVDEIKTLMFDLIDQTQADFGSGVFTNYVEYHTSAGYFLKNVEQAIEFNNFHEGIHIGVMLSIRKHL